MSGTVYTINAIPAEEDAGHFICLSKCESGREMYSASHRLCRYTIKIIPLTATSTAVRGIAIFNTHIS